MNVWLCVEFCHEIHKMHKFRAFGSVLLITEWLCVYRIYADASQICTQNIFKCPFRELPFPSITVNIIVNVLSIES